MGKGQDEIAATILGMAECLESHSAAKKKSACIGVIAFSYLRQATDPANRTGRDTILVNFFLTVLPHNRQQVTLRR